MEFWGHSALTTDSYMRKNMEDEIIGLTGIGLEKWLD